MQTLVRAEDEAAPPPGTTRADFWSGRFCISGDIATGDRRLLDVLRDATRQYLDIRRVRVSATDAVEVADGLLSKTEIEWVAVRAEPSRAESRLYGYVKKTPVHVKLVLASHLIEGNVFVDNGASDPGSSFLRSVEKNGVNFIAVASASVIDSNGASDTAGLAIVNRSAVRLFSVSRGTI